MVCNFILLVNGCFDQRDWNSGAFREHHTHFVADCSTWFEKFELRVRCVRAISQAAFNETSKTSSLIETQRITRPLVLDRAQ